MEYNKEYHSNDYGMERSVSFNQFLSKVFMWMFLGLLATTATAFYVATSPSLIYLIATNQLLFFGLIIGQLVLVIYLSKRALKMSFSGALGTFILYSVLNGVTLSIIFFAYSLGSIYTVFGVAALIFVIMAMYGYFTKTDLSAFRAFLFIGLIGVVIMSVVNIFLQSGQLSLIIGYIGVGVFAGLTAYDIQKMKQYYLYSLKANMPMSNIAIIGALTLYLDFINLFLFLLRILGRRR